MSNQNPIFEQPNAQNQPPLPPPVHPQQAAPASGLRPLQADRRGGLPGCLLGGLVTLLALSLVANVVLLVMLAMSSGKGMTAVKKTRSVGGSEFVEYLIDGERSKNKVAIIEIYGVISYDILGSSGMSMVDEIITKLNFAAEDNAVKAIILDVDSPGGEVNASDVLYHHIKKVRDEHNKPIVAHFRSVAASGAYYAAMGCTKIVANRMTVTGSIGVILQSLQYRELFQKVGLKTLTFKSGKFKDLLNPDREPTKEELDYVQDFVMQTYEVFASIVESERGFTNSADFRANIADGRIFSGQDALRLKVVDELGYFKDAQNQALNLAGISEAQFIKYDAPPSLSRIFRALGVESTRQSVDVNINGLPKGFDLTPGKAYFLLPSAVAH